MTRKHMLLMVVMFMSGTAVYAQKNRTDTNPCKIINEKFSEDSVSSFSEQPAVRYKLLPSIKQSGSCLEIRIYDAQFLTYGKVFILKSVNDSIVYDTYQFFLRILSNVIPAGNL